MKKPLAFDPHAGIDLHVHSSASDGTFTPAEILTMAVQRGLKAIAITDHDTLSGSADAIAGGIPAALQFITGVEISAAAPDGYPIHGSVHLLGYGINLFDPTLTALVTKLNDARQNRNPQIVARLAALGMHLDMDELARVVAKATPGRPHIARLMIDKGMAASIDDAFDRFLGKTGAAYVEKARVPMPEAIAAIHAAGGVAVLAHPHLNGLSDPDMFESFLLTLKKMGLQGIEAIYPSHPRAATRAFCHLARKHDLLITGGTDFHGAVTPGIDLGVGGGDFHVPYDHYASLVAHLEH